MEIRSLADFVRLSRATLTASGFERRESAKTVWFEGPRPSEGAAAVVLVHGANDQAGTWCAIAPVLARRFRVIIPDLAGHGESEPKNGPLPISLLVERLAAAVPEQPFVLIGNSLGGWIAMLYALRHPERVRMLVLEAAGGLDRPFAAPVVATTREEAAIVLRAVHGPDYGAPEWVVDGLLSRSQDSPMLRVTGIQEHYLDDRLAGMQMETHLVWGADDGVLPLSYAEELRHRIPGAQLHVIEGAAHIPHLQQPQRYLECLSSIF